jgi:glutaconate CoA-transferase subunit A
LAERHSNEAADLAALIPDGAFIALPPDYSMPAMEVVRILIRKKSRNLRLLGVPVLGMCADLLIGAGCVAEVESSAVSLGEAGLAPRFTEAVEKGDIRVRGERERGALHAVARRAGFGSHANPNGLAGIRKSILTGERSHFAGPGDLT